MGDESDLITLDMPNLVGDENDTNSTVLQDTTTVHSPRILSHSLAPDMSMSVSLCLV